MNEQPKNINAAHTNNIRITHPRQRSVGSLGEISNQAPIQSKLNLQSRVRQSSVKEINRDRLIEQNRRLKNQVLQLAEQMDQIITKGEDGKKKYGINFEQLFDPQTEVQRLQTKKQEIKILQLKNQLFELKKEIDYVYDERSVIEKENNIKQLQNEIKALENQKAGVMKVRKEQEKALNFLKNDNKYNQKIEKSRAQLSKLKQECKVLVAKTVQNEKLLLKAHQKLVSKTKKIKQVQEKIKQNKQKIKKGNPNIVTIEMISQIEDEISKLESEYKQSQKNWLEKINNLDVQYNNRRIQQQKKLLILKQKEREVKINEIKLKQFRKLIFQQKSQAKSEVMDAREFRNKRNIKFLQKSN